MSKTAIISAIQRGLHRGKLPPDQQDMLRARLAAHPRHLIPARGQLDREGRIALFIHYAEREFATTARLPSLADIPTAITAYLAQQNLPPTLVASPHPALQVIPFDTTPLLSIRFGTATPSDTVSLQSAFAGIAETGTLMLPSGPATPTSNNLLPDTAIVVLQASQITASYEDAFDLLRSSRPDSDFAASAAPSSGRGGSSRPDSDFAASAAPSSGRGGSSRPDSDFAASAAPSSGRGLPRNIMLVTGPSRSADIEQTLELGAHGPRRLHVLIIDGAIDGEG